MLGTGPRARKQEHSCSHTPQSNDDVLGVAVAPILISSRFDHALALVLGLPSMHTAKSDCMFRHILSGFGQRLWDCHVHLPCGNLHMVPAAAVGCARHGGDD